MGALTSRLLFGALHHRERPTLARLIREGFPYMDDDRVAGYCSFPGFELMWIGSELVGAFASVPRPAERLAWLELLVVSHCWQRRGLAGVLLARFEQRAGQAGLPRVALATRCYNHSAQRLYERCGYSRARDPHSADWIYSKNLEESA